MKSYTDLEQSKKLSEILPIESADWTILNCFNEFGQKDGSNIRVVKEVNTLNGSVEKIPCWSLAALLEILDYPQLSKDKLGSGKEGWMVSVYPNDCRYDSCWHDNPVDACYEMIIKLHELKML